VPILMTLGASLLAAGGLGLLGLLFASGGWRRSRQFAILGQLWSGALGSGRRLLVQLSLAAAVAGAALCFAGVASMDAERARGCHDHCIALGFEQGSIGPSVDRSPSGRFVACTCSADAIAPLELRADAIPR